MAKILVVDDMDSVRTPVSDILKSKGHVVHKASTVEDGIDALRKARGRKSAYEVALIDLRFDNYDGVHTEPEIAGTLVLDVALEDPFLEAIILTAFPSIATAQRAVATGVFRYLIKGKGETVPTDEVVRVVDLALANRELIKSLDESIRELRRALNNLSPEDQSSRVHAQLCLKCAEEAYRHLLIARGRKL